MNKKPISEQDFFFFQFTNKIWLLISWAGHNLYKYSVVGQNMTNTKAVV